MSSFLSSTISRTQGAVAAFTGESDYQLGDLTRSTVLWMTGDRRPFPRVDKTAYEQPEALVRISNVQGVVAMLVGSDECPPVVGQLRISPQQVEFVPEPASPPLPFPAILPMGMVADVELPIQLGYRPATLTLILRDFRALSFIFETMDEALLVFQSVAALAFPPEWRFRHVFRIPYGGIGSARRGWPMYDLKQEFTRQQISGSGWRLTTANQVYALCDT